MNTSSIKKNQANKQVALLCNHQKTVGKNFDLQLEKQEVKIRVMKEYLQEMQALLDTCRKGKSPLLSARTEPTLPSGRTRLPHRRPRGQEQEGQPVLEEVPVTKDFVHFQGHHLV